MALAIVKSAGEWIERFGEARKATVVTIGNFDGIHLGHQKILCGVLDRARTANAMATVAATTGRAIGSESLAARDLNIEDPKFCKKEAQQHCPTACSVPQIFPALNQRFTVIAKGICNRHVNISDVY